MNFHNKMYQQQKIVFWVCDKLDCGKRNYRVISNSEIINLDRCDHCLSKIHEPITNIDNDNKHDNSKQ